MVDELIFPMQCKFKDMEIGQLFYAGRLIWNTDKKIQELWKKANAQLAIQTGTGYTSPAYEEAYFELAEDIIE